MRGLRGGRDVIVHCAVLLMLAAPSGVRAASDCVGDCNRNAHVTVDELVTLVNIALGNADVSACTAGNTNGDSRITVEELVAAVNAARDRCPLEARRTLDDLFEDLAELISDFGGMMLAENGNVLEVYLLDPSPENVEAVTSAIVGVFGPIIPPGGVEGLPGEYGFMQLREWYRMMIGSIAGIAGVTSTDINEAINRLAIGIETPEVEPLVVEALANLGIPLDAVAIVVTGPIESFSHTVQDVQLPRRGGYQVTRLINNTTGFGITAGTLGFNAIRSGVPGFVTNSHHTQVFWNLDPTGGFPPADFYQAPGYFPAEWVGTEAVDTPAFACAAPYPAGHWCRYSDSAFVNYNTGVAWDPGTIGQTMGMTTLTSSSTNLVLTVDHAAKFTVVSAPTQPYLIGLPLHKVGRTTGWTMGKIASTCVDYWQTNSAIHPGTTVRLCQYGVWDPPLGLASFGDSGSPVFRVIDPQCGYVELYGLLWGGGYFIIPPPPWGGASVGQLFVFSPIGGVPFQQTGVQSVQDLGPLNYVTAPGVCTTPTPTATAMRSSTATPTSTPTATQPCGFVAPRMCGGGCPKVTDVCIPLPDDSGCICQSAASPTPTPTPRPTFIDVATPTVTPTGCIGAPQPNLVLNPSFELNSGIPTGLSQLNLATAWGSPTNGSPDYFHALASALSSVSAPTNTFGSETPNSGSAYAGFHSRPVNQYREYVEATLSSPLVAGNTYQVSFYLSLADQSRWAVDQLGAHLSVGSVGPVNTVYNLPLSPHVTVTGYLTSKVGWTQVMGSYTAAGGEDHLVIGNFFDNPSTTPLMGQGGAYSFAYYYVDDVSVTLVLPDCTPTSTPSATGTTTPAATHTPTHTPTLTASPTPTGGCPPGALCSPTPSLTPTASSTATPRPSNTPADTPTATTAPTVSATATPTATGTPTRTPAITPTATATCITPPPNLVAWWTADNTANDLSGNGNHGALQGGASYTTGQVGAAFSLPTISDYVLVPDHPTLDFAGNFSIDAWIRTTNPTSGRATIVDKRAGTNTNPVGYHFFLSSGLLGFQLADGQPFLNHVSPSPLINDGNWHHVAVTIDRALATGGKLFVDGVQVHTFDPTTRPGPIANAANLRMGVRGIGSPQTFENFQGAIDEVELFDRELMPQEVQALFDARSSGKCKTPIPTPTPTFTTSATPTRTRTSTPTASFTITPRPSNTSTPSRTPTSTPTASAPRTPTRTPTASATATPTLTHTPTRTASPTATGGCPPGVLCSPTPTLTPTASATATPTASFTPTRTPTRTPTASFTATPTRTPTSTRTATPTSTHAASPTITATRTATPTATPSRTPSRTPTASPTAPSTATATATRTPTHTPSATSTRTPTGSPTPTPTRSPTSTATASLTPASTATATDTRSPTLTPSITPTRTVTTTPTATPTRTPTGTPTHTPTRTPTHTPTRTPTVTPSQTPTPTGQCPGAVCTPTATPTATLTRPPTATATRTPTGTPSHTPTHTPRFPPQ
jgi:hypothetical protein